MISDSGYAEGAGALREDFIPRGEYAAPDIDMLEEEKLWPKVWQVACREEEIPNIGDYVIYDIAAESFLIVRTAENKIGAFYNVCTHRGRRLRTAPTGNVAVGITCPFHAWRFDLEGNLKHAPNPEGWKASGELDKEKVALMRPRVDRFAGWVWLSMDENAPPLLDYLAPAARGLMPFALEDARLVFYKTLHVPVNWKVVLEAFIEGYHSHGTHPQMMRYGSLSWAGELEQGLNTSHGTHVLKVPENMEPRERFYRLITELNETLHAMFLDPGLAAARRVRNLPEGTSEADVMASYWQFHREELEWRGAKWPEALKPEHLHNTMWHVFPNTSILPTVDGALWYRFRPDPDKHGESILDVFVLGRFAPGCEHSVKQEVFPTLESFKGQNPFLEQDFGNLIAVNKGMRSRAWKGANINPAEEVTVYHFHRNLRSYLTAEG